MSDETAPAGDDTEAPAADDLVAEVIDLETQRRLWIRSLIPLLQLRSHDSDPSGRVQLAFDLMHISVCDRIRQLLHADVPSE